jgi:hypothetical protein
MCFSSRTTLDSVAPELTRPIASIEAISYWCEDPNGCAGRSAVPVTGSATPKTSLRCSANPAPGERGLIAGNTASRSQP